MNVMKAITTATPRPERAADRAIERTTRPESDRNETDATAETEKKRSVSRAEFSALLALISGAGSRVRSDLIQQLPAEGASLVDKLLDEAAAEQTTDESTADTLTGEGAFPGEKGLRTALQHGSHDREAQEAAQQVSEALRYGILNTSIDNTPTEPSTDDIIDLPTYAKNRGTNGLLGISRAAQQISAQLGGQGEIEGERNALAVLSRIATKRGSSLEQLMAIGDVRGADARAALDALLAKAGTPAGTEIADNAAAAAAASASASALAAATAASAADPTTPIKDLDAVAPELRSRVQRVIDRMKGEYGHDVSIVETARSQERQDHLYEQGRTRPGAVVTWTRDSAHTRGDAVDVIVDGSWENAQGFARLQRIAKEEGLRTLGMKDPGHLELANHGERALANAAPQALDKVTAAFQRQSSSAAQAASQAAPAGVAQVASVAGVAQVARVADANAAPAAMGEGAAAYVAQANANKGANGEQNGNAFGRGARDENGHPINDGRKLGHTKQDAAGDTSGFGALHGNGNGQSGIQATGAERAASVGQAAGSEQAQRVSEIQAMRADAPAGPLSRMTLNVDNANGTQDRITVDLRGNVVDTFISTDASSAERMKLRTGELQESLSRHGLDAESVRISGASKSEQNDSSRAISSERDALRTNGATQTTSGEGAQSQSQRDRATGRDWDKQQDARREQKEQAAREQQREQANQRGWQNLFNGTK
ncbi:M15 family metallopeptidase [Gemmatimonas groenlandica]|uniref:M15 family metallopeptidase n=1 Tax=Gemmatimonas groenlandica TaxID=2732249 RepID=A0A6M4IN73_9BACT|nr:M15 family metallopeptidase [Gemmatimonas groenlandica]QJR36454.1 M15 family metallopeptidase [Gemmatimonas groenlandica]